MYYIFPRRSRSVPLSVVVKMYFKKKTQFLTTDSLLPVVKYKCVWLGETIVDDFVLFKINVNVSICQCNCNREPLRQKNVYTQNICSRHKWLVNTESVITANRIVFFPNERHLVIGPFNIFYLSRVLASWCVELISNTLSWQHKDRKREGPTLAWSQTDTNRQLQSEDCCLFGKEKVGGENVSDMQLSGEHFHMQNSEWVREIT